MLSLPMKIIFIGMEKNFYEIKKIINIQKLSKTMILKGMPEDVSSGNGF